MIIGFCSFFGFEGLEGVAFEAAEESIVFAAGTPAGTSISRGLITSVLAAPMPGGTVFEADGGIVPNASGLVFARFLDELLLGELEIF